MEIKLLEFCLLFQVSAIRKVSNKWIIIVEIFIINYIKWNNLNSDNTLDYPLNDLIKCWKYNPKINNCNTVLTIYVVIMWINPLSYYNVSCYNYTNSLSILFLCFGESK